jgi:segregation and condensation protein B
MHTSDENAAEGDVALVEDESEAAPLEQPPGELGEPSDGSLSDDEFLRAIAALVFASPEPISERKLAALLAGSDAKGQGTHEVARVTATLEALKARLQASGLPLDLRSIAGGWQILTTPDTSEVVKRLFVDRTTERISPAALETLAVVAYRQPVTKAEIEAIRGVQVGPILRTLVDRGLAKVVGRADVPGHPLQYGTTKSFLDRFGLSGLDDLPRDSELAR